MEGAIQTECVDYPYTPCCNCSMMLLFWLSSETRVYHTKVIVSFSRPDVFPGVEWAAQRLAPLALTIPPGAFHFLTTSLSLQPKQFSVDMRNKLKCPCYYWIVHPCQTKNDQSNNNHIYRHTRVYIYIYIYLNNTCGFCTFKLII
jgi:hypothetical protein